MRHLLTVGLTLLLSALLILPAGAASTPKEDISKTVDQVLAVLRDPQTKGAQRREKVSKLVRARFDFATMSQYTLGKHWKSASPEEQKEFIRIFSDLLEETYIGRIDAYSNETVKYGAESIEGDRAEVKTSVHEGNVDIPIDYRLTQKNGEWFVYDVLIEDVSLVKNFRSSYGEIIRKEGFTKLLERMTTKLKELRSGAGKPAAAG
jgi:phospholipid transport system substrate-binding protein